jgi:hypothetical protein
MMPTSVLNSKLAKDHAQHIFGGGTADDVADGVGSRSGIDKNSIPVLAAHVATERRKSQTKKSWRQPLVTPRPTGPEHSFFRQLHPCCTFSQLA